eukprot:s202_g24.t1
MQEIPSALNDTAASVSMAAPSSHDPEESRLFRIFKGILEKQPKDGCDTDQHSVAATDEQSDEHDQEHPSVDEHENHGKEHDEHSVDEEINSNSNNEDEDTDTDAEGEPCFAVSMTHDVIDDMFKAAKNGKSCVIFKWKSAVPTNTLICFVEACQSGKVLGTAKLKNISVVQTFADLRSNNAWKRAPKFTQQVWREYVVKECKKLYAWNFDQMHLLDHPKQLNPFRGKCLWTKTTELGQHKSIDLPGLDLRETGAFFINRLEKNELQRIKELCLKLHNKTITVGSTCSGTDICINVVNATIETLCKLFQVS